MNNKITADDAKEFFQFYRAAKKGYMVSCSNSWHNDSNPSVHIYDSEDTGTHKLMVKCFGGCDPKTILKHINDCAGGRFSPDMIQKISKGFKATRLADQELELTNTYSYKDRNYKVKFQVLRFVDKLSGEKTFRYRRPATKEEQHNTGLKWVYRQEGLDLILYNLPELDIAINNDLPVFIVEGEGKADIIHDLGLVGTCNAFGGTNGKFLPQYADDLRGASVVLVPDNDITGYNHIYECFSVLDPVVKSIKVVILPVNKEHEDIKEWLSLYGGSKEQLLRLVGMADELKGQTIEYVKDKYKYMDEFADDNADLNKNLYSEYNDLDDVPYSATITDTSPITKVVLRPENFESLLSPLMSEKLQAGEILFEEQGVRAGLCDMCFGYGFKLGMNEDGFPAVVTEKIVDEEGNESVILPKCNHGIFEENASDFGF